SGRSTRPSRSSMVLLPDPLAPVSATQAPAGTSNEGTSSRKLSAPATRRRLMPCKLNTAGQARSRQRRQRHGVHGVARIGAGGQRHPAIRVVVVKLVEAQLAAQLVEQLLLLGDAPRRPDVTGEVHYIALVRQVVEVLAQQPELAELGGVGIFQRRRI